MTCAIYDSNDYAESLHENAYFPTDAMKAHEGLSN